MLKVTELHGVSDRPLHVLERYRAPEWIARCLRDIAIVGPERVIASTDCGFGTFAGCGKIDPDVVWKKLTALRQGADLATGRGMSDRGTSRVVETQRTVCRKQKSGGGSGVLT